MYSGSRNRDAKRATTGPRPYTSDCRPRLSRRPATLGGGAGSIAMPARPTRPARSSAAPCASAGRARSAHASSSREISPSAWRTARYGRFRSSWYITVEMRGLISSRRSPMNCTLTSQSRPSSRASRSAASTNSGRSTVSNHIASPARIASRVFACPSTRRPSRQMPSTVCSGPVTSSITSSGGKSSGPIASSASSTDSGSGPGRASSNAKRRSTLRREDAEAARALGRRGLHADVVAGIAERLGRGAELVRRA